MVDALLEHVSAHGEEADTRRLEATPLPGGIADALEATLRSLEWPVTSHRRKVSTSVSVPALTRLLVH